MAGVVHTLRGVVAGIVGCVDDGDDVVDPAMARNVRAIMVWDVGPSVVDE